MMFEKNRRRVDSKLTLARSGEAFGRHCHRNFSRELATATVDCTLNPRSVREVAMQPPAKKRRIETITIEEIKFDPAARQEYLTGFHKRKLQRAKDAQEAAEKKARLDKVEQRRKVRRSLYACGIRLLTTLT